MGKNVIEVVDSTFQAEVLNSPLPVLVDFWAPWCGPCRMVAPVVEDLSVEMEGKVKFTKLNVEDAGATAANYGVTAIPTLLIFKGGQVVQQHVGALSKPALKGLIERAL